jgi:hypothetical protein
MDAFGTIPLDGTALSERNPIMGAALDSYVGLTGIPNAIGFTNSEGAFTPELEPLSMSTIQLKSDSAGAIIPLSPSTASNLASLDTTPAADSLTGAAANAALVGDLRTGQYIALENMGANFNDDYQFLDGRTADGTVGLAPNTDASYSGTKWRVYDLGSVFGDEVVRIANEEWVFFGNHVYDQDDGYLEEGDDRAWQRIAEEYWQTQGIERIDIDTLEEVRDPNNPWSAAFISWVMQEAGAGDQFNYSQRHAEYINQAIEDRESDAAFIRYRIEEYSPQVGDLIGANRSEDDGITVTYDTAVGNDYASHVDIVVATRDGEIDVIGGNVEQSVTLRTLQVDPEGKLINPDDGDETDDFFVVIDNRLGAPVA